MEHVPYSLIKTHERIFTETNGHIISIDHRIFVLTPHNEIYYTLVGELQYVLYARAPLLRHRILSACTCNGKIAVIQGGYNRREKKSLGDFLIFTGTSLHLLDLQPLPLREHAVILLSDTHLLIFGGRTLLSNATNDTKIVNLHDGAVCDCPHLQGGIPQPCARYGHSLSAVDGRIFLYGGTSGKRPLNDLWEFIYDRTNPLKGNWVNIPLLPSPEWHVDIPHLRGIYGHTALPYEGQLLVFSGTGNLPGCFYLIHVDRGTITHSNKRYPLNTLSTLACIYQNFIVTTSLCINVDDLVFPLAAMDSNTQLPNIELQAPEARRVEELCRQILSHQSSESLHACDLQ